MYKSHAAFRRFLCLLCALLMGAVGLYIPTPAQAATLRSAPMRSGGTLNGMVRVYLSSLGNPSQLDITVSGSYTVNGQSTQQLKSGSKVTVKFNSATGALTLTSGGTTQNMGTAFKLRRHSTDGENGLRIAQAASSSNLYPGDLSFEVKQNGTAYKLYTIAYVYIEDYLYGVVPYEMGNSSPLEALKAQAVTARTYTLRAMQGGASRSYDVVDTTSDQVYRGTPSGSANCKAAVDATKGIVSMNGSSLTATYYTASNGGQIESVKNLWGSSAYSYITVKDDPYDYANPDSRVRSFTVNASGTQSNSTLGALLNTKAATLLGSGAKVTAVSAVTPHTPKYASPSRLYTKLDFDVTVTLNGATQSATLTFDIFGELETPLSMSNGSMKNELWTVTKTDSGFKVEARRWGHGTGMSQRGAMQMANLGYTYDQILNFYFDGCTRVQYSFTRSILSAVVSDADSQEQVSVETAAPLDGATPAPGGSGLLAKVTTASGSLNLRAEGTTQAKVLKTIPRNTVIEVAAVDGDWARTSYDGTLGYVMTSFLTFIGAEPTVTPTPGPTASVDGLQAKVTTVSGSLNLRASNSTSARVLTTIPRNQVIAIAEKGSVWCRTRYGSHEGYVMTKFLTFLENTAPTPTPGTSATTAPTTAPDGDAVYAKVTTKTGGLNLRAEGKSSAKVLLVIPQHAVIRLTELGTVWCRTTYNGVDGYVMTSFLTLGVNPETTTPSGIVATAQVTTEKGSLNLRADDHASARVLRTIPQYAWVDVYEKDSDWCNVTYEGTNGYVMTKFLTFGTAPATATPVPITPTPAPAATATTAPTASPTNAPADSGDHEDVPLTDLASAVVAQVNSNADALHMRSGPGKDHNIVLDIPKGDFVMVTAMNDTWCRVIYEGKEGFCMREFLILPDGY